MPSTDVRKVMGHPRPERRSLLVVPGASSRPAHQLELRIESSHVKKAEAACLLIVSHWKEAFKYSRAITCKKAALFSREQTGRALILEGDVWSAGCVISQEYDAWIMEWPLRPGSRVALKEEKKCYDESTA
ncbi:uncharacterized protein [Dermacentor albipictus]|uniref:uncharacterized protein isoform X2 n=1 Tax=Dermacentor albipictus TaxID=60249 RepID=UPI0038FC3464